MLNMLVIMLFPVLNLFGGGQLFFAKVVKQAVRFSPFG